MAKPNNSNLTLTVFINGIREVETPETALRTLRSMQSSAFSMAWNNHKPEVTRTYTSIGHFSGDFLKSRDHRSDRLSKKPIMGQLRAKNVLAEDIRFIVFKHDKEHYLILDNPAKDSGMVQVHWWDKDFECFIGQDKQLIDFMVQCDTLMQMVLTKAPEAQAV